MTDRETLETLALANVSPTDYYDLCDTIGETSDEELKMMIGWE